MIFQQGNAGMEWFYLCSLLAMWFVMLQVQNAAFFSKMLWIVLSAKGSLLQTVSNPYLISSLAVKEIVCKEGTGVNSLLLILSNFFRKSCVNFCFRALFSWIQVHFCFMCCCLLSFSQSIYFLYVVETIMLSFLPAMACDRLKPVLILVHSGFIL